MEMLSQDVRGRTTIRCNFRNSTVLNTTEVIITLAAGLLAHQHPGVIRYHSGRHQYKISNAKGQGA